MKATVRQMAILAGGLATRLGAISAETPKAALPIGGRPFLAWQMQEISRFGVEEILFLCGHLSDRLRDIVADIAASLPKKLRIRFSEEPVRAGTGGALFHARAMLDARFLLCNGDSFFDTNLAALLADAAGDGRDVLARMVVREVADTSRFGLVTRDGDRVSDFAERGGAHPGLINAGIYLLDRRIIAGIPEICSLERDVLPSLARAGQVRASIGAGYFIDIGIPDDLHRAEQELPAVLKRRALFLDRDGTINVDYGWVGSRPRWEFVAGATAAIRMATEAGWHVFIVTNQSGIARGYYGVADVADLHAWVADAVRQHGGTIDDVRIAPQHPDAPGADGWRKPGPGMLRDLLRAWQLDPGRAILVGDQPTDIAAAQAAGIAGHLFPGGNLADFIAPLLK